MRYSRGFSLMEIIVVLVVIGLAAAVILPNLVTSVEQSKAQVAKNNLLAIMAAQQKYFEDHAAYCVQTTPNNGCGGTTANLSAGLHLGISDHFNYTCTTTVQSIPYNCAATEVTTGTAVSLSMDPNAATAITCTQGGTACPN